MLKLLIFVPCDKVIIAEGGQSSAIGVLEVVTVGIIQELPPEAMIPYKWNILTLWHREEDVLAPVKYKVLITLLRPDGTQALKAEADLEVTNEYKNFRNNVDLPFLPAGMPGTYQLKLSLQKEGEELKEITAFPMLINHRPTHITIEEPQNLGVRQDAAEQVQPEPRR